jgi:hypothetical protein
VHLTLGILRHFHLCLRQGAVKHFSLACRPEQAGFEFFCSQALSTPWAGVGIRVYKPADFNNTLVPPSFVA